jgi:asparagine synthase (glutamine-hydrolysing)
MCGIAGIITGNGCRIDVARVAAQMRVGLKHRGPDDCGLLSAEHCALAHTRLSILDPSPAGHQPMGSSEGRYWISYNGEIYNYRDLRKEINDQSPLPFADVRHDGEAQSWRSNSDTEVILRMYARHGLEFLPKLRGMFAFAIWDQVKERLIMSRDALGIKPLYYYQGNNFLIFASEVRSLLASGLVPRVLSDTGLQSYLHFGSVQDPLTVVAGVHSVIPGECLTVQRNAGTLGLTSYRYQQTTEGMPRPETRRAAVAVLRQLLEESVLRHLVSDVPIGAFLSGGIDSSAVVALMHRVTKCPPKTFSVVFKELEYSEARYARLIARKLGTDHREIMLHEDDLLEILPSALASMDQPSIDGVNTFVVSKAVKEAGISVALSGLGGDELFAGYPSFQRARQLRNIGIAPLFIRRYLAMAGRLVLNGSPRRKKICDLLDSDCSPYAAYAISRRLFAGEEIVKLLNDPRPPKSGTLKYQTRSEVSCYEADRINAVSNYELKGYMTNTLLRDTDQMSMAHGLEVRVPFVDQHIVNYVLDLPGRWKLSGNRPKPLLVDALDGLLPEEIWRRPKKGFVLPFQRWMQSGLRADVSEELSNRKEIASLGLDADAVCAIGNAFEKDPIRQPWSRPWAFYVLKKWCSFNHISAAVC